MNKINGITQAPFQNNVFSLSDGTSVSMTLKFVPLQYGWFIYELIYQNFILRGFRIFTSPNMLQQYMNQIPFGIACYTQDNFEPKLQKDFSSGYAELYVVTKDELALYEGSFTS
jgi:hypothetical protein